MNYDMLINAFMNNGLPDKEAWDAAYLYRCIFHMPRGATQSDYDETVKEEMSYWD